MTDELIVQIVANVPNFVGLVLLAWVQWRVYMRMAMILDNCLTKLE